MVICKRVEPRAAGGTAQGTGRRLQRSALRTTAGAADLRRCGLWQLLPLTAAGASDGGRGGGSQSSKRSISAARGS